MIKIYKSKKEPFMERIDNIEKNCWIDLVNPTIEEIDVDEEAYVVPCISIMKENLKRNYFQEKQIIQIQDLKNGEIWNVI